MNNNESKLIKADQVYAHISLYDSPLSFCILFEIVPVIYSQRVTVGRSILELSTRGTKINLD